MPQEYSLVKRFDKALTKCYKDLICFSQDATYCLPVEDMRKEDC